MESFRTPRLKQEDNATSQHTESISAIEHVFTTWDNALGAKDIDAAMALYHPDATLESPEALSRFVEQVFAHQPPQRRRHRTGLLSGGTTLTWEYPHRSPAGEQMDIVEVMEIRDGLIRHHRVYWGWYSVQLLQTGQHPR